MRLGPGKKVLLVATLLLAASCIACPTARSQEVPRDATSAPQTPSAAAIPSYPDTPQGLEKLMKDMMRLAKRRDKDGLAAYGKSLVLPKAENWFKSVFGEKLGAQLVVASERARSEVEMSAPDLISRTVKEKLGDIQAVRFDEECNPLATDTEYPFLALRVRPEPLYDVRFHDSTRQLLWSYFAHVDGGFRFIGNLALNTAGPKYTAGTAHPSSAPSSGPRRIRVGGNVQAANLLRTCQVLPRYPEEAKQQHVEGTVILHAIIGADGEVHDLQLVSGPPALVQTSMEAVKRWRYRPTLFNGEPVEVDTTISVVFTLGG